MHRRIKKSVYYGAFAVICSVIVFLIWQSNLRGTIVVDYVDQNGTALKVSKKIVGPINSIHNIKAAKVRGYTPNVGGVDAQVTTTGSNYKFVYVPDHTSAFTHLMSSNYIGVSAQDVTTNSISGVQNVSFGQGSNRLRVMYANKINQWKNLNVNYPNIEVQDPKLTKFGSYWFITYTGGILRTADFSSWQQFQIASTNKYPQVTAPSLIHVKNNRLAMSFTSYDDKGKYNAYVSPFNYNTGKPDLSKTQKLRGLENVNSVDLYKGTNKYYALYTKGKKDTGKVFLATSNKITGKYSVIKKITPPNGMYYYAPNFVKTQAAKATGIEYSSYYYNESSNMSYSHAFYRKGILGSGRAVTINGEFALQKISTIQIK